MVRRRGHIDTTKGNGDSPKRKRRKATPSPSLDSASELEPVLDNSELEEQPEVEASASEKNEFEFAEASPGPSRIPQKKSRNCPKIREPNPVSSPGNPEAAENLEASSSSTPTRAEVLGPNSERLLPPNRGPTNAPNSADRSSCTESEDPPQTGDKSLDVSLDSETGEPRPERVIDDLLEVNIPAPPKPVMASDGTGNRLMISKIINENFKSYYGRHEIGPFHKNFTSIVGPNGSGKSNVIDSLLFVFGYRAQRIRSKKVSVLIHNSEGHENVRSCTVEIHFQLIIDKPNDEFDVVPGSQFFVSRTAFSDNSSHYQLNGKKMQFKEVSQKLQQHGIDLIHNRFLILQGEVEQIALMKPKAVNEGEEGMLEYLEDIVGSSRLKAPIEQLSQKVDELNELRTEKLNRVRAAEKEKEELEGPKNEAIAFLEEENKLTRAKSRLYQLYMKEMRDRKSIAEAEYNEKKVEYDEKKKEMDAIKLEIAELEKTLKKMKKQAEAKQAEADKKKAEYNEFEKQDVKASADIKNKKAKILQAEKGMASEEKKLQQLKEQPEKSEREVKEQKEVVERCEKKEEELQERLEEGMKEVGRETEPHRLQKQKKEEELMERKKAVNQAKAKADLAQNDLDMYLRNKNTEQNKLDKMRNKKSTDEEKLKELHEKLESADRQIPAKQELVDRLKEKIRALSQDEQRLVKEVSENRLKTNEARSNMQQAKSKGRVLDTLLAAKNKGEIPGIHGRLGDLGAIDEKFDVAISTCCGALEWIVVDTVDTATECVSLLKRSEAGLATFLSLDKQESLKAYMRRLIQIPDRAERLFDLIRVPDDRILPAFYYALRDTLVANTMDDATKIAYQGKRWRVVTLRGELIETSGTLTGGGNRQMKGRMGRQVAESPTKLTTTDQLAKMEETLTELSGQLVRVRREKQEAEDELNKAEKLLAEIQPQKLAAERQIKALEEELKSAGKKMEEQAKAAKDAAPDEAETEKRRKGVEDAKEAFEAVKQKASSLEEEVKEIDERINEITDRLVGLTKKSLESTKTEKKKAEKSIIQTSAAATKAEREIKKCEEKISSFEQEIKEAKEDINTLREDLKRIEDQAAVVCQDELALKKEVRDLVEEMEGVKEEKKTKEEEAQAMESRDLELKTEVETKKENLVEAIKKGEYWAKELRKLTLHDLREFQSIKTGRKKKKKPVSKENAPGTENEEDMSQDGMDDEGPESDLSDEESDDDSEDVVGEKGEVILKIYSEEEVKEKLEGGEWKMDRLKFALTTWEEALKNKQGRPNLRVIQEYQRKELKYLGRVRDLDEVTERRDVHRNKYEELKKMRMNEFMLGFSVISTRLKEMYQMITLGGDAELELVDTMDPFAEGIQFSVRPPKKSWKQISNLSGGEKTLSSLALVFALHHYKPTPLYVMDEIDAALDFKNVSIVANYIKERTKNGQFVIISLRNNMFELADRLVGIYKTYNCTKHVVINPEAITLGRA